MSEFTNKNVIITGASKGLGKTIAIEFEKLGCNLALIARSKNLLNEIENETNESHFVHISGLIHKVSEGDLVEYNLEEGKKGMNAVEVRLIEH